MYNTRKRKLFEIELKKKNGKNFKNALVHFVGFYFTIVNRESAVTLMKKSIVIKKHS